MSIEYTNKKGIQFIIEIEKPNVPTEADYWLFYLKVTEQSTQRSNSHPAWIKREFCQDESSAIESVKGTPIKVLKSTLDNWEDGNFPIHQIETPDHWVIFAGPYIKSGDRI